MRSSRSDSSALSSTIRLSLTSAVSHRPHELSRSHCAEHVELAERAEPAFRELRELCEFCVTAAAVRANRAARRRLARQEALAAPAACVRLRPGVREIV